MYERNYNMSALFAFLYSIMCNISIRGMRKHPIAIRVKAIPFDIKNKLPLIYQ